MTYQQDVGIVKVKSMLSGEKCVILTYPLQSKSVFYLWNSNRYCHISVDTDLCLCKIRHWQICLLYMYSKWHTDRAVFFYTIDISMSFYASDWHLCH